MRVGTFSRGIIKLPQLTTLLKAESISLLKESSAKKDIDLIVGWGRKGNTLKAQHWAYKQGIPYASLEDGFIRSAGLGRSGIPSLSYIIDYSGVFYDATTISDLETLLESNEFQLSIEEKERAQRLIAYIVKMQISKYCGAPDYVVKSKISAGQRILIVDQVKSDSSIYFGCASKFNLRYAIDIAHRENPHAEILVKLHPETIHGYRKGFYRNDLFQDKRITLIKDDVNPLSLIKTVDHVYVGTSQLGFEALLLGKKVTCFGIPFYAGWGLTDDRQECTRRTSKRSIEEIFTAAYIRYSHYINPVTGQTCELEDALKIVNRQIAKLQKEKMFCYRIRHWKRYNILPYLPARRKNIHFIGTLAQAKQESISEQDQVLVWGKRTNDELESLLDITGKPLVRMEDGFLRSVGLGSDFVRPSSLILDQTGIYFDPRQPSDLENLINFSSFSDEKLEFATTLRKKLLDTRLSKYNGHAERKLDLRLASNKKIILIPGQVADDASVQCGCSDISDNISLIRQVRKNNPDAYLIYKPHPDVLSGNRKGKVPAAVTDRYCDKVVEKISLAACLDVADEVHTMTSLVGFEALLREITVVCYGLPFYAGWGLTQDKQTIERRRKNVTLNELVVASLMEYPVYYDWESGYFATCEEILDKLVAERDLYHQKKLNWLERLNFLIKRFRQAQLIIKGVTYAR